MKPWLYIAIVLTATGILGMGIRSTWIVMSSDSVSTSPDTKQAGQPYELTVDGLSDPNALPYDKGVDL